MRAEHLNKLLAKEISEEDTYNIRWLIIISIIQMDFKVGDLVMELQAQVNQARVQGMQQIGDLVYYDNNSDDGSEDDDDTVHDTIQVEDVIEETNDADDNIINRTEDHRTERNRTDG